MDETEIAPDPQLMESMRAVGYTLETAVADVIDNSITAQASRIDLFFAASPEPYVAILDNGTGMDEAGLLAAMRLAGRSPLGERSSEDLGRFGLGLKTASLSQCRTLTVVSKTDGQVRGVRWSLEHLAKTGRWALLVLDDGEIEQLPEARRLDAMARGTLVLWTDLDQINALPDQVERQLDEDMIHTRDHLALVFHRFISAGKSAVRITINGADVPPVDPFLTDHRATQVSSPEEFTIAGEPVRVQAFTLPYVSKLTNAERSRAHIAGTMRDSQGFYIYRAKRLVIWGTWFRIVPKDDLGKLARVRVDIPNSLDHMWSLDIKKSTAFPPPEVKTVLRRLAGRFVHPSKNTHIYRGRPARPDDPVKRLWTLVEERGSFRYEVDREHPSLASMSEVLDKDSLLALERFLRALESSFPVEDAYNRLGSDAEHKPTAVDQQELADMARLVGERSIARGASVEDLAAQLSTVEPFTSVPDLEKFLRKVFR